MVDEAVSPTRCPRCASRRIPGKDRCAKCDWRFEHPAPPPPEEPVGSFGRPMIIEVRPDPFERRQVARWILATFEVSIITGVIGWICFFAGATAATAFSAAIGNDVVGQFVSALVWGPVSAVLGAWLTLRFLAR